MDALVVDLTSEIGLRVLDWDAEAEEAGGGEAYENVAQNMNWP